MNLFVLHVHIEVLNYTQDLTLSLKVYYLKTNN
nr:hypothetical protein CoNPh37_CDS0085 [Staphylococcus phage S-CoN_Ph37]